MAVVLILALEKIKLAQPGESLPDALAAILVGLGMVETISRD
jgi:hypothetical protein